MKKHSLYLRQDQITFLRNLDNASQFVREAIDTFISNTNRSTAEKTICVFKGAEELQAKIASQALIIEGIQSESEKIEEEIKKVQLFLKVARNVANGKFELQQFKGKWRVLAPTTEGKYTIVTDSHDTEEEAKNKGLEKGKIGIESTKRALKELEEKKRQHERYVEAQRSKFEDMQKNLETLRANMK